MHCCLPLVGTSSPRPLLAPAGSVPMPACGARVRCDRPGLPSPPHALPRRMVVNGVAIGSDYDKLFLYICTASPADPKPDACYDLPERMRHQG